MAKQLHQLATTVAAMMAVAPRILSLFSENSNLDDPAPVSDVLLDLNAIVAMLTPQDGGSIASDDELEPSTLLDRLVGTYCDRLMSNDIPQSAKNQANTKQAPESGKPQATRAAADRLAGQY